MFLNGAAEKLKREQDARKAELRRKQALERRAAATAEARRRERDDAEKRERLEQRQRDAEARVARERVLANNEGVAWDAALVGVRSDAAVLKGIRARADDKIVLPPSAWRAVNAEARANIAKLMHVRGQRLAVMESRPPPAHWVVLSATGSFT